MPFVQNYVHFVWATWDRRDTLEERWEEALYAEIRKESKRMKCVVRALNGIANHVHLLVDVPPIYSLAEIAKQLKGPSSLFVNDKLSPSEKFKWQEEYAAFSVSRWDVPKIKAYIERQKEHHANGTAIEAFELPPLQQLRNPPCSRRRTVVTGGDS